MDRRTAVCESGRMRRLPICALSVVALACGPDAWEEPEVVSRACETDEAVRLSEHPGAPWWFAASDDAWSLPTAESDGELIWFHTVVFDPCGGGDLAFFERSYARPIGDGYLVCGADDVVAWAEDRASTPVPFATAGRCLYADESPHGIVVETDDDSLLHFATPSAPGVVIAENVDQDPSTPTPHGKWVLTDDAVWAVTGEGSLERFVLATGARETVDESVSMLGLTTEREAIAWSTFGDAVVTGKTTVLDLASGVRHSIEGSMSITAWPGVVVATDGHRTAGVLDLAAGVVDQFDVPDGWPARAEPGVRSLLWITSSRNYRFGYGVLRIDFDGGYEHLADISLRATISVDQHGDGLIVNDWEPGPEQTGVPPLERGGVMRISASGDVDVLLDRTTPDYLLAADGRLLYSTWVPGGDPTPGDLRVRNPDGSDRLFASDTTLVLPHVWAEARTPPLFDAPDLEGDVLVNRGVGDERELWRMPFAATK